MHNEQDSRAMQIFTMSCEALKSSHVREQAISWILKGHTQSYCTWALNERYGSTNSQSPENQNNAAKELDEDTKKLRFLCMILSPLPMDEALLIDKLGFENIGPTSLTEIEAIIYFFDNVPYFMMSPFEILLRHGEMDVYENILKEFTENGSKSILHKPQYFAMDRCGYFQPWKVRKDLFLAKTKHKERRYRRPFDRAGDLKDLFPFLLLSQTVECESKANMFAKLFTAFEIDELVELVWPEGREIDVHIKIGCELFDITEEQMARAYVRITRLKQINDQIADIIAYLPDASLDVQSFIGSDRFVYKVLEKLIAAGGKPLEKVIAYARKKSQWECALLLLRSLSCQPSEDEGVAVFPDVYLERAKNEAGYIE